MDIPSVIQFVYQLKNLAKQYSLFSTAYIRSRMAAQLHQGYTVINAKAGPVITPIKSKATAARLILAYLRTSPKLGQVE
jgi:hypothetical protein